MARRSLLLIVILAALSSGASASEPRDACSLSAGILADPEQRGCCSWHGGVCGCSTPRVVCCDGALSPSCRCKGGGGPEPFAAPTDDPLNVEPDVLLVGDVPVRGYFRRDGTYVAPHWRSAPDSSYNNNWSTYPNVNPYTGQQGTNPPRVYDPTPNPMPGFGGAPTPRYGAPDPWRAPRPRSRSRW